MRKTGILTVLALTAALTARADFSYTISNKAAGQVTKQYLKGQKMKMDMGSMMMIMDFDSQTVTQVNPAQKTYTVTPFTELGQALKGNDMSINVDVKETGQRKNINGFNSTEIILTMDMDSPTAGRQGMGKMRMEMDMWVSPDVPGAGEMKAFYQRNANRFPWGAFGGGNPSMQKAMADLQRKMATLNGVPVLQIMRMKPAGSSAQNADMQKKMADSRKQLEDLVKKGGPGADYAKKALDAMGGGTSGALMEMTMESGNFSTAPIPESTFTVPAGYTKTTK